MTVSTDPGKQPYWLTLTPGGAPRFNHDTQAEPGWQPYFADWLAATAARIKITDPSGGGLPQGNTVTLLARAFDGMDDALPRYPKSAPLVRCDSSLPDSLCAWTT